MQNIRKLIMRLFAFLLVCALLMPSDSYTAAAEEPAPATAQAVAPAESATVLSKAEPAPVDLSADSSAGYIERQLSGEEDNNDALSCQEALELRRQVVSMLESYLGTRYVYGGFSPRGFDCSGLVYYIYNVTLGYEITRCADTQLLNDGTVVAEEDLQPGDLVFFREPWSPWAASHVGIYVGNRQMIHASNSGVRYDSLDSKYYANSYVGARRLIQVEASTVSTDLPTLNLR